MRRKITFQLFEKFHQLSKSLPQSLASTQAALGHSSDAGVPLHMPVTVLTEDEQMMKETGD